MTDASPHPRRRIAVFSRYSLAEQYDLAAEFHPMLTELGQRSDVLHLSFRNTRPAEIPPGVQLEELPLQVNRHSPRDIQIKSLLMYALLPLAAWKLRRQRPELIFVSEILPFCGLFFKIFCRTRVAITYGDWHVHNFLGRRAWSRPLLRLAEALEHLEARHVDGFFCRASTAGKKIESWGVTPEKIRVVRDAPDLSAFFPQDQSALRRKCGFQPDDVVLLYHGVMHQGKGIDLLIRWTAELRREIPGIGLILVGAGPELKPLQDLAAQCGLGDRVYFTGWLKTIREVGEYCNAADICIAMRTGAESNVHIVPGALLHSMACRKVVLGPRLAGIQEVIREGVNGYLFAADDGADFKQLIRKLAANRTSWDRVAEQAYQDILANYAVPATAHQYAAALEHFATPPNQ